MENVISLVVVAGGFVTCRSAMGLMKREMGLNQFKPFKPETASFYSENFSCPSYITIGIAIFPSFVWLRARLRTS